MTTCALLVPTFRDNAEVRATLSYLAWFAGDSTRVVVADNSERQDKHDFLKQLARRHANVDLHLHAKNVGGARNLLYLLEASADAEFVALCSDDDHLSLPFVTASIDVLLQDPTASACAGHLLALLSDGACVSETYRLGDPDPFARLRDWFDPSSFNLLLYCVHRRQCLQPWIDFTRDHPLRSAFFDFLLTTSAVSRGRVLRHAKGAYVWSAENWDTPARNAASRVRWLGTSGLPEAFVLFFDLHFAIEEAALLLGRHSPVADPSRRVDCASVVWHRCMARFRQQVAQAHDTFASALGASPGAIDALRTFLQWSSAPEPDLIRRFPEILKVYSESLASAYARHLDSVFV